MELSVLDSFLLQKKTNSCGQFYLFKSWFHFDSNSKEKYFSHILSNKKKFKLNNIEQQTADKAFYYHFLNLTRNTKVFITNSDRNISHEKYFKNLKNFLEKKSLSDRYYQKLKKHIGDIKF